MPIFGNDDVPAGDWATAQDRIMGSRYTCPEIGEATSITVALKAFSATTINAICALYSTDRSTMLQATEERSIDLTDSFQWFTFNFASPYALTKAYAYNIVVWVDYGAVELLYGYKDCAEAYPGSDLMWDKNASYDPPNWINCNANLSSTGDYCGSIYCTFEIKNTMTLTNGMVL